MKKVIVEGGFYKMKVGSREYKIYLKDLRMMKKLRKKQSPPLPKYDSWIDTNTDKEESSKEI